MSDTIGAMRARVTLQSQVRVQDELGGAAISWTTEGAFWAEISASGGAERTAHDRVGGVTRFRLSINRYPDVRVGWRVLWSERVLRVVGISDDGAPRMNLSCEEEAP